MITKSMFWPMAVVLVTAFGLADCSRSDSTDTGAVGDGQVSRDRKSVV